MLKFLKILTLLVVAGNSHVLSAAHSYQESILPLSESASPLADPNLLTESDSITLGFDIRSNAGRGSFLDQVATNMSSSIVDTTLFDGPGGATAWSSLGGGIHSRGCSGSGSGLECSNNPSLRRSNSTAVGSNSSWDFDVTKVNGEFFTGFEEASVKGRLFDVLGKKAEDVVSENVTSTSADFEPETYAMILAGLGLMGYVARRRNSQGAEF